MKSKAAWIAVPLATVLGVGMAVAVAGASGSSQRGTTTTTTTTTTTGSVTVYDVTATSPDDTGETYFDANGDNQDLTISGNTNALTVSGDSFVDFSFTCDPVSGSSNAVVCDFSQGLSRPFVRLATGSDRLTIAANDSNAKVNGGPDADTILGGGGRENLGGGPGDDKINGGGGPDRVNGGKDTDKCKAAKAATVTNCESKSTSD